MPSALSEVQTQVDFWRHSYLLHKAHDRDPAVPCSLLYILALFLSTFRRICLSAHTQRRVLWQKIPFGNHQALSSHGRTLERQRQRQHQQISSPLECLLHGGQIQGKERKTRTERKKKKGKKNGVWKSRFLLSQCKAFL